MFCRNCGKEISDDFVACPYCGAAIGNSHNAADKAQAVNGNVQAVTDNACGADVGELEYCAKRSVWFYKKRLLVFSALALFFIILFASFIGDAELKSVAVVSIVLAIVFLCCIVLLFVMAAQSQILFYKNKLIVKSGILNKKEAQSVMTPLVGISVNQSFNGLIWNYGEVRIDKVGKGWDIDTTYIHSPKKLKAYLESKIGTGINNVNMFMNN